jgi:hypothetical protein
MAKQFGWSERGSVYNGSHDKETAPIAPTAQLDEHLNLLLLTKI